MPSTDSKRRTSPLVIGAVVLAIVVPVGFGAWLVLRGLTRPEVAEAPPPEPRVLLRPHVSPLASGARLLSPRRPMLSPSALAAAPLPPPPPAPPPAAAVPPMDDDMQMAVIDRAARGSAALKVGLTPEETARLEEIRKAADRKRDEIAKHEWVSDEDATALHDNAVAERRAVQDSLGESRAQLLRTAEHESYSRILRDGNFAAHPNLRGRLILRQGSTNLEKVMAPAAPGAPPAAEE